MSSEEEQQRNDPLLEEVEDEDAVVAAVSSTVASSVPQHPGAASPTTTTTTPTNVSDAKTEKPTAVAPTKPKHSTFSHTVASQCSGAISTTVFYPFDVVKMRFMAQDGTAVRKHNQQIYKSTVQALRVIWREEGVRALFQGVHVAVFGAVAAWGIYMTLFRFFENIFGDHFLGKSSVSICASTTSAFITNPIWLVKTRMQLEERQMRSVVGAEEASAQQTHHYRTFRSGLVHAVEAHGWRSLWRGLSAQLLLGVPNAFSFPIYDWLKKKVLVLNGGARSELRLHEVCACSTCTKVILTIASHPLMVIKTRLMDQRSRTGDVVYKSLGGSIATTMKREGLFGMYRGVCPALMQNIPRAVSQFCLYEMALWMM